MTPAQRRHVALAGCRRQAVWPWFIIACVMLTLAAWAHAIREVRAMERELGRIEPQITIVAPSRAMADDLDSCHRRLDAIDATIVAIERRRGQEPPRTLVEQRSYRAEGWK